MQGIGATIGGGAGLLIGLREKIAGVETPEAEAKRLIQQTYHINANNAMANSVVQIADQKYGGTISVAVRSPDVRQILGLYAAGTSQKMATGFDQPFGASLVNSGGRLMQNSVSLYGGQYAYQSQLPVYGGGPTQQIISPTGNVGGPTMVSLHIDGTAAGAFMTGQYVTPQFVGQQYNSSLSSGSSSANDALTLGEPGTIWA
jgi:hypothetical protein